MKEEVLPGSQQPHKLSFPHHTGTKASVCGIEVVLDRENETWKTPQELTITVYLELTPLIICG